MLFSFQCRIILSTFCYVKNYRIFQRENKDPHHIHNLGSRCFTKKSAFNVAGNLVIVAEFRFQIVFGKSRQNPRHASARGGGESLELHSMTFDLIGEHQNKRFYVTEIILSLMFADVIFRRERSDDRKYVCGSQASCGYVREKE